jgi:hypothetical protein
VRPLMLAVVSATLLAGATGVNVSGKWALQTGPSPAGASASPQTTYLVLNQVGSVVSGKVITVGARSSSAASPVYSDIWEGRVEGDVITFYVWAGRDQVVKTFYRGTIAGDQITFTVTGGPPTYNFRGELNPAAPARTIVAKRSR